MADNSKTYVHWALWSDKEEQEWIAIGKTRFDAHGHGLTKFTSTPTCAWGWRCITLPLGERPPQLPPVTPQQPPAAPEREAEDAEQDDDGDEILPGAR